jgi:ribonuclease/clavin/mitogillin
MKLFISGVMDVLISLAQNIWVVTPETKPRYPYGNCMYIEDDIPTVIDLGAGARAFAAVPCDQIQLSLLSHFHFDHIHGDSLFKNSRLMAGYEERLTYSNEEEYLDFHGYHLWEPLMGGNREAYGQVIPLPDDVLAKPGFRIMPLSGTFTDGDVLNLGKISLTAVHLPGHTCGHYGFYLEKEGILFSADIDLVAAGPWYSSNSANVGDLIKSVEKIKEMAPRIIVPSHRRIQSENIAQQLDRYIQIVLERNQKIFELLKTPRSLDDLAEFRLVFPRQHNLYELFWEKMTIRNHLRYLIKQNLVQELPGGLYRQS